MCIGISWKVEALRSLSNFLSGIFFLKLRDFIYCAGIVKVSFLYFSYLKRMRIAFKAQKSSIEQSVQLKVEKTLQSSCQKLFTKLKSFCMSWWHFSVFILKSYIYAKDRASANKGKKVQTLTHKKRQTKIAKKKRAKTQTMTMSWIWSDGCKQ